jgi:hypothetical protein
MSNEKNAAEPSGASVGSHGEPVAWEVFLPGVGTYDILSFQWEADAIADALREREGTKSLVLALYRGSRPTLTDEEREAIEWFVGFGADRPSKAVNITRTLMDRRRDGAAAATLRALLERLGGAK